MHKPCKCAHIILHVHVWALHAHLERSEDRRRRLGGCARALEVRRKLGSCSRKLGASRGLGGRGRELGANRGLGNCGSVRDGVDHGRGGRGAAGLGVDQRRCHRRGRPHRYGRRRWRPSRRWRRQRSTRSPAAPRPPRPWSSPTRTRPQFPSPRLAPSSLPRLPSFRRTSSALP